MSKTSRPFRITRRSTRSAARTGSLQTTHGRVSTPAFMPIATRGAVKAVDSTVLQQLRVSILLANTYHLAERPGTSVIKRFGGLHAFMRWDGPILTDSGGFQVFSLSPIRTVTERGVRFRSPLDGAEQFLTPERAMGIQRDLGSDIAMVLDELVGYPASKKRVREAAERSLRWAGRCVRANKLRGQLRFGIVQGGIHTDLRTENARGLVELPFDGYAIGGLAVGEPPATMLRVVSETAPVLPENKPRYLMGVGKPEQVVAAVRAGIDMFDCVLPTRNARHGVLWTWGSERLGGRFYREFRVTNARFKNDTRVLDSACDCPTCRSHTSRAYLHQLFRTHDPLAALLATQHNVRFMMQLMERVRENILSGQF